MENEEEKKEKKEKEKKEMNYRARYSAGIVMAVIVFFLTGYLLSSGTAKIDLFFTQLKLPMPILGLGVFLAIVTFLAIVGIFMIPEAHRGVIERFTRYKKTLKPGLKWIPLPGIIDRIKKRVFIKQRRLHLWQKPIKIDFLDGSAEPVGSVAFVEIENPDKPYLSEQKKEQEGEDGKEKKEEKRAEETAAGRTGVYRSVYHIDDVDQAVIDQVENAARSYLNSLTVDKGLEKGGGGYDLLDGIDQFKKEKETKTEGEKLRKSLSDYGIRLVKVTIDDFNLDPDLLRSRAELHKRTKEREAAKEVAKRRAVETVGTLVEMISQDTGESPKKIQKEIKNDPKSFLDKHKELIERNVDLIIRRMGIDGNAYLDIRTPRAGGKQEQGQGILSKIIDELGEMLIRVFVAKERTPMGETAGEKKRKKEKEGPFSDYY